MHLGRLRQHPPLGECPPVRLGPSPDRQVLEHRRQIAVLGTFVPEFRPFGQQQLGPPPRSLALSQREPVAQAVHQVVVGELEIPGRSCGWGRLGPFARRDQLEITVEDLQHLFETCWVGLRPDRLGQFGDRFHPALDIHPDRGEQGPQHCATRLFQGAVAGVRRARVEGLFQEVPTQPAGPSHFDQCFGNPATVFDHLREQCQPDRDHLAFVRQPLGDLPHELFVLCAQFGRGEREAAEGPAKPHQHGPGMVDVEQVDGAEVLFLHDRQVERRHEPRGSHREVVADEDHRLQGRAIAFPQRGQQFGIGDHRMGQQPLFKLVDEQHQLAGPGLAAPPADKLQGGGESRVGREFGEFLPQRLQQPRLGLGRRSFDEHGTHVPVETGNQPGPHQARLATPRRAVEQPDPKGRGRVGLGEAFLPEGDAAGQPTPLAGPGKQVQEELLILLGERAESSGGHQQFFPDRDAGGSRLAPDRQFFAQFAGRSVPLRRTLRQQLVADAGEFGGDVGSHLDQRRGVVLANLLDQLASLPAAKRPAARQHLVENDSQREQVAAAIQPVTAAAGLFGAHVRGGPRPGGGQRFLFANRQPEVGQPRMPGAVLDEDVLGLHVAMNELLGVGVVECRGHGANHLDRPLVRHAPSPQFIPQRLARNQQRHHEQQPVRIPPQVVHRDNVGMAERGERAGLGQVLLDIFGRLEPLGLGHLDRDIPPQLVIAGLPDPPESPFAQQLDQPVAANELLRSRVLATTSLGARPAPASLAVLRTVVLCRYRARLQRRGCLATAAQVGGVVLLGGIVLVAHDGRLGDLLGHQLPPQFGFRFLQCLPPRWASRPFLAKCPVRLDHQGLLPRPPLPLVFQQQLQPLRVVEPRPGQDSLQHLVERCQPLPQRCQLVVAVAE